MTCTLLSATDLFLKPHSCAFIKRHLTWPSSDFHKKLDLWIYGEPPSRRDGHIAIVEDHGEIVGWARTELWADPEDDFDWATLEAFVAEPYRDRGIAAWAASALVVGPLQENRDVAVFRQIGRAHV